jgi:hypothetical protein
MPIEETTIKVLRSRRWALQRSAGLGAVAIAATALGESTAPAAPPAATAASKSSPSVAGGFDEFDTIGGI